MSLLLSELSSRIGPCTRCPTYPTETTFGIRLRYSACWLCLTRTGALHAPTNATSALSGALFVAIHAVCPVACGCRVSRRLPGAADRANSGTRVKSVDGFRQHSSFHNSTHSSRYLSAAVCTVPFPQCLDNRSFCFRCIHSS